MSDKEIYLFKIEFFVKDKGYDRKECWILSNSYDQAERIAMGKNDYALIDNISKIAVSSSSLFFDESEIAIFSESHL